MSDEVKDEPRGRRWLRRAGRAAGVAAVTAVVGTIALVAWLETGPVRPPERRVGDVTELIDIGVERVAHPRTVDEVQAIVARHEGPISIGGGRFSMGGQIATDGTLFLDMRDVDEVVAIDADAMTVRVEAGCTWRKLIEALDPHGLSVKIMQSYANFTVGGTLSVNAHGRYVNLGPVVHSVRAIELVLADGTLVRASRTENPELFWGAIGGYGALGVIVVAELDVAKNEKLERTVERMPVGAFQAWFAENISGSDSAVMFNADLYPPDYEELVAITFSRTDRDVTDPERLQPEGGSSRTDRFVYWWVSEGPLGKETRSEVIDRMRLQSKPVVWRNNEASYDVHGLDPGSREKSTYVLQEYFVPVERFEDFVPEMARIFQEHDVNVVNVSIRHAEPDPDTLLSWAPVESYAFVIYYKMKTSQDAWDEVGVWTREMIDALVAVGGRYYLPYQLHATDAQFHASYPRAGELFALKSRVDPDYTFRSHLWDAFLPPSPLYGGVHDETAARAVVEARATWRRPEDQTFLTVPEWIQVYSADELGSYLAHDRPSTFPFLGSVGQFWTTYRAVWGTTRGRYPFNTGYHGMIWVIGASWTVEGVVKGLYEGSVGRLTEWWSGPERTPEEELYATFAADYGAFIHHTPWYAYPFAERRAELWAIPSGPWSLRRGERFVSIWLEFTAKSIWGRLMGGASGAAYGTEELTIEAWVRPGDVDLTGIDGVTVLQDLGRGDVLVSIPRYEPFTATVRALAAADVEIVEVAGGRTMLVQVQAPSEWDRASLWGDPLIEWPILTVPGRKRVTVEVAVRRLDEVLPALEADGVDLERLYDY